MQTITNAPTELAPSPRNDQLPPLNIQPRRRFLRISWFFLRVIIHVFFFDILLGRWRITRWYVRRTAMTRWVRIARNFRGVAARTGGGPGTIKPTKDQERTTKTSPRRL